MIKLLGSMICLLVITSVAESAIIKIPVDEPVSINGQAPYDPTDKNARDKTTGIFIDPDSGVTQNTLSTFSTQSIGIQSVQFPAILMRWPANGDAERPMENEEAYYRDAFVGIRFTVTAQADGDQWWVEADHPVTDGSLDTDEIVWLPIIYYAEYFGAYDCFYAPGWLYAICGSKSHTFTAFTQSQCDPVGLWTMRVIENNVQMGPDYPFAMKMEVPLDQMGTPISQITSPEHQYDRLCYLNGDEDNQTSCSRNIADLDPNLEWFTIGEKGCAMTSTAMAINYHGNGIVSADQGLIDYNDFLVTINAFDHNVHSVGLGNLLWGKAGGTYGLEYLGAGPGYSNGYDRAAADEKLRFDICTYGPQVLSVKGGGHFVTAYGKNEQGSWKIFDPNGAQDITLAGGYNNYYSSTRRFRDIYKDSYPFPLYGVSIELFSPAEILVTTPEGKKIGFDPTNNNHFNEVEGAVYDVEGLNNIITGHEPADKKKFISLRDGPPSGEYAIQVTGTDSGTYDLHVVMVDTTGNKTGRTVIENIPISVDEVHKYAFEYSAASTEPVTTEGGYDGVGQQPAEVNKFLRFVTPTQARTFLPVETSTYNLRISYGDTVQPATFTARLNNVDISSLFSPVAGTTETVSLNLVPVSTNTLILKIEGVKSSGRVATDTDRLKFIVQ